MGTSDKQFIIDLEIFLDDLLTQFNNVLTALNSANAQAEAGTLTSGTLAINGAGALTFKTTTTIYYTIANALYKKAAFGPQAFSAATPALAATQIAVWAVVLDAAGNVTTVASAAVATPPAAGALVMPSPPSGKVAIGFIVIETTGAGAFTPNTTALDAANMTVTYVNGNLGGQELLVIPTVPLPYAARGGPVVSGTNRKSLDNFY